MTRRLITLLLVALLALAAAFVADRPALPPIGEQAPKQATPGAILTQATTRQYDGNGRLQYILKVARAEQFFRFNQQNKPLNARRGYTDLSAPRLTLFSAADESPWQLRADFGKTENSGEEIQLWGNVVATKALPGGGEHRITTEKLQVLPSRQQASTDRPVRIESPQGKSDAIGMEIDMPAQKTILKSQVKAIYEPDTTP